MTKEAVYTTVIVGIIILFAFGLKQGWFNKFIPSTAGGTGAGGRMGDTSDNNDGDLKCELQGTDGRTITITGRGAEFERLCRQQNQPVYLYGYNWYPRVYYRWYRPWGWRRWHGGSGGSGGTGM